MFRRLMLTQEQKDSLEAHQTDRSISARSIAHQHNTRHSDNPLTARDVENIRQAGHHHDRNGLADTAAFIGKIRSVVKRGIMYARFNWDLDDKNDLRDVFWAYNLQGKAYDI